MTEALVITLCVALAICLTWLTPYLVRSRPLPLPSSPVSERLTSCASVGFAVG